jgi:SpoVK/Ycf46/Vps4 family AAA+-type ATPase
LIIDYPEKIIPASEGGGSTEERMALVTLLKWASSQDIRRRDIGVILVTESAQELHADLLRNPHVAQIRLDLPDADDRAAFIKHELDLAQSDLDEAALVARTSGLNLLRVRQLVAEAVNNGRRITHEHVTGAKKRLIEEYCQGLVRFKDPKPGVSLDLVATHEAAKKKLRELAWLIRNGKTDVLERGILVPGRVGVGKSFLIDCFASECGLPVMELGEFRSKWVGDTERQQARILMTVRALGPVIVVVDEADAGLRQSQRRRRQRSVEPRLCGVCRASRRLESAWPRVVGGDDFAPDLLAIDMKAPGPLRSRAPAFSPRKRPDEVVQMFGVVAKTKKDTLASRC